jgi:hypothetical protein
MQKLFCCVIFGAFFVGTAAAANAGDLKLTIAGGRVTLIATDVPVRQILAEWARVGKTTIVNGEKLSGPPLTLQLVDVPETQALETLLRSASGYVAAQRASLDPSASVFDRIMIMPTSRAPAASASASPFTPNNNNRMAMPQPVDDNEPLEQPIVPPSGAQPQQVPTTSPGAPGFPGTQQQPLTSPRPGMLPAPPQTTPNPLAPPTKPGGRGGGPGGPGGER